MTTPDFPPEVAVILGRIWPIETPIVVHLLPRDAWIVLGLIQFASRNPAITETQRQLMERFGRAIQRRLGEIAPGAAKYLEMGWNPAFDVPREEG